MIVSKPIVLDIFSGAGGMSEGFIQAGFDVAFACDINKMAELTYMNRHKQLGYKSKFACINIEEFAEKKFLEGFLEGKEIDVVCGGPPCPGFSLAGKRDKSDPRNILFRSYIKTIENVQPNYFVMENVEGILSMKFDEFQGISGIVYKEKTIPEILKNEFLEIGYKIQYKVLQSNDFGVPQIRRRVFFLGHRILKNEKNELVDLVVPPRFPERCVEQDISIKQAIDDLSFLESGHVSKKYRRRKVISEYQLESINGRTPNINGSSLISQQLHNHEAARHTKKVIDRFSIMKQGENLSNLKQRLGDEVWKEHETNKLRCQRVKGNEPSPTILTLPDDLIHYSKNRIMTVREFARIQSFDDSFIFYGKRTTGGKKRKFELPQYTQVGNAVPPLMAKAVAEEILRAFNKIIVKDN
jgi:DNA (cytosine-5)-methyltransferase 1